MSTLGDAALLVLGWGLPVQCEMQIMYFSTFYLLLLLELFNRRWSIFVIMIDLSDVVCVVGCSGNAGCA